MESIAGYHAPAECGYAWDAVTDCQVEFSPVYCELFAFTEPPECYDEFNARNTICCSTGACI
jgi:hypothetical protein